MTKYESAQKAFSKGLYAQGGSISEGNLVVLFRRLGDSDFADLEEQWSNYTKNLREARRETLERELERLKASKEQVLAELEDLDDLDIEVSEKELHDDLQSSQQGPQ